EALSGLMLVSPAAGAKWKLRGSGDERMIRAEILDDLTCRIDRIHGSHPVRVGIDGIDAAGKTTLAEEMAEVLRTRGRSVVRASIDGFHRPRAFRYRRGPSSPEGYYYDSFDYETLMSVLLRPLGPGGDLRYREAVYDLRADRSLTSEFQG